MYTISRVFQQARRSERRYDAAIMVLWRNRVRRERYGRCVWRAMRVAKAGNPHRQRIAEAPGPTLEARHSPLTARGLRLALVLLAPASLGWPPP
jgi:hypothetical protein